ncbi:unnamed protein product, partial [Rotaria socialis]
FFCFFNGGDGERSSEHDCEEEALFLVADDNNAMFVDGKRVFYTCGVWVDVDVEDKTGGTTTISFKTFL